MPISGPELGHLKMCYRLMHVNYYDYMSESSTVFWRTVYFYFERNERTIELQSYRLRLVNTEHIIHIMALENDLTRWAECWIVGSIEEWAGQNVRTMSGNNLITHLLNHYVIPYVNLRVKPMLVYLMRCMYRYILYLAFKPGRASFRLFKLQYGQPIKNGLFFRGLGEFFPWSLGP